MTKRKGILIALLVLVSTALGFYAYSKNGAEAISLSTATVDRGDVVATVGATGTVEAVSTVQVGTQVTGTIWKLYADFNSQVQKNQVVARLEPSLFESRLTEAKANLASADANRERARVGVEDTRRKLVRAKELADKDLLPKSELDVAQLAFESAEAQLKSAEAQLQQSSAAVEQATVNLEHTVIRSPINGVVISRNVDVGQTVAASLQAPTLFTIAEDLSKMRVVASVDEADVGSLKLGEKATFRVDAFPEDNFEGRISQVRLAPIVVQNVVTYNALVEVDNRDLKLRPGMTANVTFEVARHDGVLRIPNAALRYRPSPELLAPRDATASGGSADAHAGAEGGRRRWQGGEGHPPPQGAGSGTRVRRPEGGEAAKPAGPAGPGGPPGRNSLFVVQPDGKLRPVPIRIGLTDGSYTEIAWGRVEEGDRVATGSGEAARGGTQQQAPPSPMRFMGFGGRR